MTTHSFKLGIVGHAQDKFTPETEERAKQEIRGAMFFYDATCIVSGGCHLGGVDI